MKIAQVSATFPPYMAGTGNVCYNLSIELSKRGHDVTVLTTHYPDIDYTYPNTIRVKRFKSLFKIGNAPFIPQLLKELKDYDIIHLHYPFFFGEFFIYLAHKRSDIPYIITYHNDVQTKELGLLKNIAFKVNRETIAQLVMYNASKIITLSEDYARNSAMRDIFAKKRQDIVVLPNGVDINRFHPKNNDEKILHKHNIPYTTNIILFVAALDRAHTFKGLNYLLKAFKCVHKTRQDVHLLIVGGGELLPYYKSIAAKIGISKNTIFVGRVSDEELPKYYGISDIVVLPSTGVENFPLVLLEAMSSGKPVIASNLPGVRRVVNDGLEGILVPPRDTYKLCKAIEYLLDNPDIRKKMGRNGRRKIISKYSWKILVEKLEKIYKEVVK